MTRVKVEGLKDLEKSLLKLRKDFDLSRATVKGIVRRGLIEAAEPIVADAEASAPVFRGDLRESVAASGKLSKRQKRKHRKGSEVEIFVGAGPLAQATKQEFGTRHHPPQPFLRPAFDTNWRNVLKRISLTIAGQIDKSAKRAARKAARAATR